MSIAFRILKATNTLSEYVIILTFPLQQWLQEKRLIVTLNYIMKTLLYVHVELPTAQFLPLRTKDE